MSCTISSIAGSAPSTPPSIASDTPGASQLTSWSLACAAVSEPAPYYYRHDPYNEHRSRVEVPFTVASLLPPPFPAWCDLASLEASRAPSDGNDGGSESNDPDRFPAGSGFAHVAAYAMPSVSVGVPPAARRNRGEGLPRYAVPMPMEVRDQPLVVAPLSLVKSFIGSFVRTLLEKTRFGSLLLVRVLDHFRETMPNEHSYYVEGDPRLGRSFHRFVHYHMPEFVLFNYDDDNTKGQSERLAPVALKNESRISVQPFDVAFAMDIAAAIEIDGKFMPLLRAHVKKAWKAEVERAAKGRPPLSFRQKTRIALRELFKDAQIASISFTKLKYRVETFIRFRSRVWSGTTWQYNTPAQSDNEDDDDHGSYEDAAQDDETDCDSAFPDQRHQQFLLTSPRSDDSNDGGLDAPPRVSGFVKRRR